LDSAEWPAPVFPPTCAGVWASLCSCPGSGRTIMPPELCQANCLKDLRNPADMRAMVTSPYIDRARAEHLRFNPRAAVNEPPRQPPGFFLPRRRRRGPQTRFCAPAKCSTAKAGLHGCGGASLIAGLGQPPCRLSRPGPILGLAAIAVQTEEHVAHGPVRAA